MPRRNLADTCSGAGVFLALLFGYARTVAPTITFEDSGELVSAAFGAGIPHPPGYPLWCQVSRLAALLPLGNVAFRLNLSSALLMAAAGLLGYHVARLALEGLAPSAGQGRAAAVAAGILGGAGVTAWSQSVISEVYALNALLIMAALLLTLLYRQSGDRRLLLAFSLIMAFGLANHNTQFLFLPGFLLQILLVAWADRPKQIGKLARWLCEQRPFGRLRSWVVATCAGILGASVLLYLPVRSARNPIMDWADTEKWVNFLAHTSRAIYGGFVPARLAKLATRFAEFGGLLLGDYPWPVLLLALVGLVYLWRRCRWWAGCSTLYFVLGGPLLAFLLTGLLAPHQLKGISVYYIPGFLIVAQWAGAGCLALAALAARLRPAGRPAPLSVAWAAALLATLGSLAANQAPNDYADYYYAFDYGQNLLKTPEQGAAIMVYHRGSLGVFELKYLRDVERYREGFPIIDTTACVFRGGSGFEQIIGYGKQDPQTIVSSVRHERDFITQARGALYFMYRRETVSQFGFALRSLGVLFKLYRPGEAADPRDAWRLYTLRGHERERPPDYWSRDLVSYTEEHRGEDLLQRGAIAEAKTHFQRAARIGPDVGYVLMGIGYALYEIKDQGESIRYYRLAVQADPEDTAALNSLAVACVTAGLTEEAMQYWRRSLALNPEQKETQMYLALEQETVEATRQAQGNRDAPEVHFRRGNVLLQYGDAQNALREYEQCVRGDPRHTGALNTLGMIYARLRRPDIAAQAFQRSLAVNPDQPMIQSALAQLSAAPPAP